jgi:2-keto-3-deoxy-L-rhamnonate aldolase RhmA
MMDTPLKDALEARDHPLGTWVSIGHPTVAEVAATRDLDFVLIDTEHTTMSLETVENLQRGVEAASGTTETVIRVPWNDPVRLKRVLDIGVAGVMVPMIGSRSEAERLVDALRYPPDGGRGIASGRATGYGHNFEEYVNSANGNILTIAQIETEAGLENAEEIAAVDGIDALFVGPADLSGALDMFGQWESPAFEETIERIVDASHAADTPVGTLTLETGDIQSRLDQGFDFLIAGKDTALLMDSLGEIEGIYEEALSRTPATEQD